jgi:site-specific DNA-adenine methylase
MSFEIWREKNNKDLYNLYKILLSEVENFNYNIEKLNNSKSYNFSENLDLDFIESEDFIEKFIKFLYDNK